MNSAESPPPEEHGDRPDATADDRPFLVRLAAIRALTTQARNRALASGFRLRAVQGMASARRVARGSLADLAVKRERTALEHLLSAN